MNYHLTGKGNKLIMNSINKVQVILYTLDDYFYNNKIK